VPFLPVEILMRTHNEEEAALLAKENIGAIFMGESELAKGMTKHTLEYLRKKSHGH
jgi:CPA2 family monovalent cation:H+ antiporter-2